MKYAKGAANSMDKSFPIQVMTPERMFYNGEAQAVTVEAMDGQLSVLAGHTPMVCALSAGQLRIRTAEGEKLAFHSKGFMDVAGGQVSIFCQACEWPEEIDAQRAQEAVQRAENRLRETHDQDVINRSKVALLRALTRLHVKEFSQKHYD